MKKHLQPCELGGSIYGKKRMAGKKKGESRPKSADATDSTDYTKLYKKQFIIMNRVFGRKK
ncbi:MAG: hypothetical protein U9R44_02215 [Candidatus Omnitrophota bacterium]|nr:hypothetical protein [Candidatus Omnitrophota bacterium]